jgi:hypothetical protein
LDVYQYIDEIAKLTRYDISRIKVRTGNIFETHPKIQFRHEFPWLYVEWAREQATTHSMADKKFDHNFKFFGSFVSRTNWHRLKLASYLHKHYPKHTLQSFHYDCTNDYHNENIGVEKMIHFRHIDRMEDVVNLWKDSPITLDNVYTYPIVNPTGYGLINHYQHFFVEIVTETYSMGNTFFPTEKIWRPIIMLTPFIVQGPRWYVVRLRELGFQTFDRWWDEGYNEDHYEGQSNDVESIIDRLVNWPLSKFEQVYQEMLPLLLHNRERLLTLDDQDIKFLVQNDTKRFNTV